MVPPTLQYQGNVDGTFCSLEKLWDDPEFEARQRELARAEARRWEPSTVAGQFEGLFPIPVGLSPWAG
jgi:hypothetical protein